MCVCCKYNPTIPSYNFLHYLMQDLEAAEFFCGVESVTGGFRQGAQFCSICKTDSNLMQIKMQCLDKNMIEVHTLNYTYLQLPRHLIPKVLGLGLCTKVKPSTLNCPTAGGAGANAYLVCTNPAFPLPHEPALKHQTGILQAAANNWVLGITGM